MENNMKRLLLVAIMVLVSLVGRVGVSRAAADPAMQSVITQLKNIQQSLDAMNYSVSALQATANDGRPARAKMDWRFYASGDFGLYQYDAENVGFLSDNIVRVSQKLVLNDRGTTSLVRELGKEYENVKEIITIRKIDCTGKKIHIVGLIYLSDNGKVIKRESYEPKEWDSIIPDSVDDVLYHAVPKCLGLTTISH
jgi:hypothetical protein